VFGSATARGGWFLETLVAFIVPPVFPFGLVALGLASTIGISSLLPYPTFVLIRERTAE
jgi:hypothetical protein